MTFILVSAALFGQIQKDYLDACARAGVESLALTYSAERFDRAEPAFKLALSIREPTLG